jgi:hypothetical protein
MRGWYAGKGPRSTRTKRGKVPSALPSATAGQERTARVIKGQGHWTSQDKTGHRTAAWRSRRGRVGKPGGSQDDGMAVMVLIVSITPFCFGFHAFPPAHETGMGNSLGSAFTHTGGVMVTGFGWWAYRRSAAVVGVLRVCIALRWSGGPGDVETQIHHLGFHLGLDGQRGL